MCSLAKLVYEKITTNLYCGKDRTHFDISRQN